MLTDVDILDRASAILDRAEQPDLSLAVAAIADMLRAADAPEPPRHVPVFRDGRWYLDNRPEPSGASLTHLPAALRAAVADTPVAQAERLKLPPSPAANLGRLPLAIQTQMIASRSGRP
jgi:hypothetical protein